jgi:transposase/DNA invertase Pin-like site-specific DNA recombinase
VATPFGNNSGRMSQVSGPPRLKRADLDGSEQVAPEHASRGAVTVIEKHDRDESARQTKLLQNEAFPRPLAAWDEFDWLAYGSTPEPFAADVPRVENHLIAIYARFSSDGQKYSSIELQEKRGVKYYVQRWSATSHTLYEDIAETGTNADRPALQKLMADIRAGKINKVIFYKFDRMSREAFDGVPFIQLCVKFGVELHCAFLGRKLSKLDAVMEAARAEEDNDLRKDRYAGGLNVMVEEEGGVPWGEHYGVELTRRRGHPAKNKDEAKIVKDIVKATAHKSGAKIAKELTLAGVPTPNGNTKWNPSTVLAIAKNIRNIGRIHFRRRSLVYSEELEKFVRLPNKPEQIKRGQAPHLRLVTDEEHKAALNAIRARNTKNRGGFKHDDRSNGGMAVFGNPICVCGAALRLHYHNERAFTHRYVCCNDLDLCQAKRRGLRADTVEHAIFEAVVPFINSKLEGFQDEFFTEVRAVNASNESYRATFTEQLERAERKSERLAREKIESDFDDEALRKIGRELKITIADFRAKIHAVPHLEVDDVDWDGTRRTLASSFDLVRARLPFVPEHVQEIELLDQLRKGVTDIRLRENEKQPGLFSLRIAMQWRNYFLDPDEVKACGFSPDIIESEFYLPHAYSSNAGSLKRIGDLAAEGFCALSDEQWSLVKDDLPDMNSSARGTIYRVDTRTIVHCVLLITKLNVPYTAPPPFFGKRKSVYSGILRFVAAGGIEMLREKLGSADPAWLEGFDFTRYANLKRCAHSKLRSAFAAARFAESGCYDLSDEQWRAIEHIFEKAPRSKLSMRRAIDGILLKLRTGCDWVKLPKDFGAPKDFKNLAARIVYAGWWGAAYEILSRDFPDAVDGLDTSVLKTFSKAYHQTWSPKAPIRRIGTNGKQRLIAAARYAEDGRYNLTDAQWDRIRQLFPEAPYKLGAGKGIREMSARTALDGMLIKLRARCGWRSMPPKFGTGSALQNVTHRIVYNGLWSAAHTVFREEFPEVLEGLNAKSLAIFTKEYTIKAKKRTLAKAKLRRMKPRKSAPDRVGSPIHKAN